MTETLESMGVRVLMLADGHGKINAGAVVGAVRQARPHREETVFFTLAMRHLSVAIAAALRPGKSVYYHITHDLNPGTIRRLNIYSKVFDRMVFICPATYRMFPEAMDSPRYTWAPQASEMKVGGIGDILSEKAARHKSPMRIGLLGRLTEEKGSRVMLDFMDGNPPPCELHVAGAGPLAGEFERRARIAGAASSRVVFHGAYDPSDRAEFLRRFFSEIDLLVVPSQDEWETLSMVTLEALQHATPALLCATGGLVSFGLPELGPAPQSVVGLVKPSELTSELGRRIAAARPDSDTNGKACLDYYRSYFCDSVIRKRWTDLLTLPPAG